MKGHDGHLLLVSHGDLHVIEASLREEARRYERRGEDARAAIRVNLADRVRGKRASILENARVKIAAVSPAAETEAA